MIQNKNDQIAEFPKPGEGIIPTELIVEKPLPPHGIGIDITKDLKSVLGEESSYVDQAGNSSPIILDAMVSKNGESVPLAIFRQEIKGGAEDGKRQLLLVRGNEKSGYEEDVLSVGESYSFEELGLELTTGEAGDWLRAMPTGETDITITGNVPARRAFNDENGPLVH